MNFKKQIEEDIRDYQERFPNIQNIHKDEWAFNFWILDKYFAVDEELIENQIVDYNDLGIDCYNFYEDTKEFYLIQNKYYADDNPLVASYLEDDFLIRPYNALKEGTYKRSGELQKAFNKYKNDPDFYVYLQIYVTNNCNKTALEESIAKFNKNHIDDHVRAEYYCLNDMQEKYYKEPIENKIYFDYTISTINNGTALKVDPENYPIDLPIKARYILTPVVVLYKMYRAAREKQYPIFDANIREFLGTNKSVNKNIYNTLMDENDRNNFFYYNNGITLVCEHMTAPKTNGGGMSFEITNPQIVNGCQTVSTIYEALNAFDPSILEKEFKNTFVLVKILQIDDSVEQKKLYKYIVKYNNSQNSIDEKTFVANSPQFVRLQREFEQKGFLLLIKQSDKNKFLERYKNISVLLDKNKELLDKFGLELTKVEDFTIELEKLLQIILAYLKGGMQAYQKKGNLLKPETEQYKAVINFIINNNDVTTNTLLNLYLLYLKMFRQKQDTDNGQIPIPYYAIDCFAKYECHDDVTVINEKLSKKEEIDNLYKINSYASLSYIKYYTKEYDVGYNTMIKKNIEYEKIEEYYNNAKEFIEMYNKKED